MVNGIDYGNGKTNINIKTGIRYGVLPGNDMGQAWVDDAESDYGDPTCPECGEIVDIAADNCGSCNDELDDDCYPDSPLSWYVDTPELKATQSGDDCDIFIVESEYYTRAGFCSPCAPGACHLRNADPMGELCYCFGHEWFEDGKAPYPVFRVSDNESISPSE